jgi:hypothetical protein
MMHLPPSFSARARLAVLAGLCAGCQDVTLEPDPMSMSGSGGAGAGGSTGGAGPLGPQPQGGASGMTPAPGGTPDIGTPGPVPLRRLTAVEYTHTIRDLLGEVVSPSPDLTDEASPAGYLAGHAVRDALDIQALVESAESVALSAFSRVDQQMMLPAACAPPLATTASQDECAHQFIISFGLRAFRRPLSDDEVQGLLGLYRNLRGPDVGDDLPTAIGIVASAFLQSAPFLYHGEAMHPLVQEGGLVRLGPYEIASRLSYGLWATMPDQILFDAAASGDLLRPARIAQEVRRMLQDGRILDGAAEFARQWLELQDVPNVKPGSFLIYSPAVARSLVDETGAFFAAVLGPSGDGKLATLFTSARSSVDEGLAGLYGVSGVSGTALQPIMLDPTQRAGVLTLGGFLAAHADGGDSNPILRGTTVVRRVLCQQVSDDPPNVAIPVVPPTAPDVTTRQRYEQNGALPCTQPCHGIIDPPGYAFEGYDGFGRYRTTDNGQSVDASGSLQLPSGVLTFKDAIELTGKLPSLPEAQLCPPRQWLRYLLGRTEGPGDTPSLVLVDAAFRNSSYDLREMLVALYQSRLITHRTLSPGEATP